VLGYVEEVDPDELSSTTRPGRRARIPTGVGPRLLFPCVPEGKVVKNRMQLDVRAGAGPVGQERLAKLNAEGNRIEALGVPGQRQLADEENESCLTMLDVESNEFTWAERCRAATTTALRRESNAGGRNARSPGCLARALRRLRRGPWRTW